MKTLIRYVQRQLNQSGRNVGKADGIAGNKTMAALNNVTGLKGDWSKKRKLVGFVQLTALENGIETGAIDGLLGPQTEFAFEQLLYLEEHGVTEPTWRETTPVNVNPHNWPDQSVQSLNKFYGPVGTNQVKLNSPYPMKLAWDKRVSINRFSCHEKVHDSMLKALTQAYDHYGMEEIKRLRLDLFGGCLNVRKMRGGDRYSTHSWGIAIDFDPEKNKLKWGRDKASFASIDYDKWWEFWEAEGWLSLGRVKNYDWMHIQAAKVDIDC